MNILIKRSATCLWGLTIACISILDVGCKRLVEIDPPIQQIIGKDIYSSNATASSVIAGFYTDMSYNGIFSGKNSLSVQLGLAADELISVAAPSSNLNNFFRNDLSGNIGPWGDLYAYLYKINVAIEGISASGGITEPVRSRLLGEAKFLRAFMYFYLVNLYGDVPLLISSDIKTNSVAKRADKALVFAQIVSDLGEAKLNLTEDYLGSNLVSTSQARLRPNRFTATALLARVYLYLQQWDLAELESSEIISDSRFQLESLTDVFLNTSKESLWQLQPVTLEANTLEAKVFVLEEGNFSAAGPDGENRPVYISKYLINDFEKGDMRKEQWLDSVALQNVNYTYAYKYKAWLSKAPRTEALIVFRLAEQYLIRAEARAQLGKLFGVNSAQEDLNRVRTRAGLGPVVANNKEELLEAVLKERRAELFTEFGHRWLDLKRTSKLDVVMTKVLPSKSFGAAWVSYKSLFPIPVDDILRNPSLKGHQNPGYSEL